MNEALVERRNFESSGDEDPGAGRRKYKASKLVEGEEKVVTGRAFSARQL